MEDYVEVTVACPSCEEQNHKELKISVYRCGIDSIEIDSTLSETKCDGCGHRLTIGASGMLTLNIDEEEA